MAKVVVLFQLTKYSSIFFVLLNEHEEVLTISMRFLSKSVSIQHFFSNIAIEIAKLYALGIKNKWTYFVLRSFFSNFAHEYQ